MNNIKIQDERKKYLKKIRTNRYLVLITQFFILIFFLMIWEIAANTGKIDSFITSNPSEIWNTFLSLSSNNLIYHIWVTAYETVIGFC